jgi:hypothetical protein
MVEKWWKLSGSKAELHKETVGPGTLDLIGLLSDKCFIPIKNAPPMFV